MTAFSMRKADPVAIELAADDHAAASDRAAVHNGSRVLSISPSAGIDRRGMFASPQVIDRRSLEDFSASLEAMIERAERTAAALTAQLEQSTAENSRAVRVTEHLQDRLRLSARMLQAFQSQIARIEAAIQSIDQRIGPNRDSDFERIATLETKFTDMLTRAEAAATAAEQGERNACAVAHRNAEVAAKVDAAMTDARAALARDVAELAGLLDQLARRLQMTNSDT